ncbi:hypothetical protein ACOJQI_10870 [Bacillus salacetis]|uniref:hypothetical protein n=1 Tax=Bacillus salacetis TaxID=2315464 RepID=UPI003BA2C553
MQQKQNANEKLNSVMKPDLSGTDPQKVKQDIQKDLNAGQGDITSREAGAYRD